ncbi:MAG TPA: ATP-binding protein, partial [Acidimicrobiia bacterium]|nr:ATP-binding protein [Acidimicrobiia bacterium]
MMEPAAAAFPLSAIVGQDDLKLALLLHAVDPKLGGVLIRGEKGSGKSTAARALATLMPAPGADSGPAPFVELPIGATEDRVVGTLDLEGALLEGRSRLRPGLLAAAHRGVLYVDEVNLLADHLVDVLIDAAAFGVNRIERDGLTAEHPCRFVLVGSMNPEEGELRPQLLDRFGLAVEVRAPRDPELRTEVVRRRLAFDADAAAFAERFATDETALRGAIAGAAEMLGDVAVPDDVLTLTSRLCAELDAEGLRADLVLARGAAALAALDGRKEATVDDVVRLAPLALAHRR